MNDRIKMKALTIFFITLLFAQTFSLDTISTNKKESISSNLKDFDKPLDTKLNLNAPKSFGKGLKKLLWPVLFSIQVIKLTLIAIFLPSILGSIGRIVGKGLTQVSGLSNYAEPVDGLDFRDSPMDVTDYYGQSTANNLQYIRQKNNLVDNGNVYHNFTQSSSGVVTEKKDFHMFHDLPESSMMLANYDPYYSPLLSRIDTVFKQLSIDDSLEKCKEKIICLMYANPGKYAPYSNLISAQLSRELNELRRPVDNPEVLRFFKYMRAAKEGQSGSDCGSIYTECKTSESTIPMMLTFNDINKLVQARNINKHI